MKNLTIDFKQINNDVNGNPRYVCHFLNLLKDEERYFNTGASIQSQYATALNRARKIHGKKFHNKQYGGGIVFKCGSAEKLESMIIELLKN
jgi:hypothetical protein